MPPRGEQFSSPDVQEAMKDVREMQQERVDAEEPVSAETLQALSEVFSMQRQREKGEPMSPEQAAASMAMMDKIVADIESRASDMTDAEKEEKEWGLRLKVAQGIHELAEHITAAEQLTREAVLESRRAPEQIGLQMRMETARDAQRSYESVLGQVHELLRAGGKTMPEGHRTELVKQMERLVGLIRHEQKIADLAQKNFIDNMDAKVAEFQRQLDERSEAA